MAESKIDSTRKSFSLDWLMRGVLTKVGETLDKFTGRNWKPSSSLATSELVERLKVLLDAEAKKTDDNKWFVPHHIKLKMQWDKFSTDAETALKKLENELMIAAIDHINDKRYHTFAPLQLEIKTDYFTEGVRLQASFDKFGDDDKSEASINVTVADLKNIQLNPPPEVPILPQKEIYIAEFTLNNKFTQKELVFAEKQRLSVGRTKENDLWIDDPSVSKIHAALVLNYDKQLMVADTGSTNGTFINNQRISYGKAIVLNDSDKLKFGTVEIAFNHLKKGNEDGDIVSKQISSDLVEEKDLPVGELDSNNEEVSATATFEQTIKIGEVASEDGKTAKEIATENGNRRAEPNTASDFDENK